MGMNEHPHIRWVVMTTLHRRFMKQGASRKFARYLPFWA